MSKSCIIHKTLFTSRVNSRALFAPLVPLSYALEWTHFHSLQCMVIFFFASLLLLAWFLFRPMTRTTVWSPDFSNLHARQTINWFAKLGSSRGLVLDPVEENDFGSKNLEVSKNWDTTDILWLNFNLFSLTEFSHFPLSWYSLSW